MKPEKETASVEPRPLERRVRRSYALDDVEVRELRRLKKVSTLKEAKELIDIFTTADAAIEYLDKKWGLEFHLALQEALKM